MSKELASIYGEIVFSICDKNVDFEDLRINIPIEYYKVIKRGELIANCRTAPYDIWSIEKKVDNYNDINIRLKEIINMIIPYSQYIKQALILYQEVNLDFYIRSEYGQMGFSINSDNISLLQLLGLDINFNILSYGKVDN